LIGRTRELRALGELLDAVRGGQSRVLVVRGEPGIGKSALLQHVLTMPSGFTTMHASGVESEMELPFAALHQLCAPMLDRLVALPEPQRDAASTAFGLTVGESPDRLLIGLAVLSLLSAVSDEGPVLCVIDDAHWLDHASAQTLTFVARRLLADPVGFVFVTRDATPDLVEFPELQVDRLHDGDALTLLGSVLHVPLDERVRDRIVAETRGNPLALVEWPRGLTPAELAGGFAMPASLPMTGQIEESFRRRVVELPLDTRRFLTLAAAEPTGDPVLVWRAASDLGITVDDATPAIDGGLVEIGPRVSFRHPLVRTVAYAGATLADRQAAHQALARSIDSESDRDRRAWHRALGAPGPDEAIAAELERSADRARARGGLAASGALRERSVALTLDPALRARRSVGAAAAYLEAGSFDVAASLLASIDVESLDDLGRAYVDLLRARHAVFGGNLREAPESMLRAASGLEAIDIHFATMTYISALGAATLADVFGRGAGIVEIAERALQCPQPEVPATLDWLRRGLSQVTIDGPAVAEPALRRALDMTEANPTGAEASQWLGFLIGAAVLLWDDDAHRDLVMMQVQAAREVGSLAMLPTALNGLAQLHVFEGDLGAAASAVAEANEIAKLTNSNLVASMAAVLAGVRSDENAAELIADQIASARTAGHGMALKSAYWANATLHNGRGEYDQALVAATEAMEHHWEWGSQLFFAELVEAAVRCGQLGVAAAALERLAETVDPSATDWGIGTQRRCQALLAEGDDAEDLFRESIDRLSRTRIRPQLARAHLLYGEWLRRENRRIDAREQLRAAHDMFTVMGMLAFAERARRELLATGETVRKRSADTFDELTPQEAHIARLAAEGYTNVEIGNQLFISARTVEWHLRKVFTKLGVKSRRELREALPQRASVAGRT